MKKLFTLMLCLLMVIFAAISVQAANRAVSANPSLAFSGETAHCQVQVTAPGKTIFVRMELLYGNTTVAAWTGSGSSLVSISEYREVSSGLTYTLKVSGTVGSESFTCDPVSKTCP